MPERPERLAHGNPFPGLRPFRADEERLFFGRESQIDRVIDKLAVQRFLAVVGTSGSGKSSLVSCGLRSALHRGYMASAGPTWRIAQFRPGGDPLGQLARALAVPGVLLTHVDGVLSAEELIEATLLRGSLGLVDVVDQADLPADTQLLVIVDQFEELFRFRSDAGGRTEHALVPAEDAIAFVRLLLEARSRADVPIYIVLTMRSDFLGDCAQFQDLPEAINEGQYLIPRMTREEIRAAITGPVKVAGGDISPLLVTRLLNDLGDAPDQLPILQHALHRTWANWETHGQGPIDLADYEAIGGLGHALDRHAEQVYEELGSVERRRVCERAFKALTDKYSDARGIRRPTRLSPLRQITGSRAEELYAVVDAFRRLDRSFLMPPWPEPLTDDSVIDISHESLIRLWTRLGRWATEEAASARAFRRLSETAALYEEGKSNLWRDPELAVALDWRAVDQPTKAWAEQYVGGFETAMAFLDRSRDAQAANRRRDSFRRMLGAALPMALLLLTMALIFWAASNPRLESVTYDWRLTHTARPETARTDLALIEIDDSSVRTLEPLVGRWPWPRLVHARLLDFLRRAPAKVVAYNLVFAERDMSSRFAVADDEWSGDRSDQALVDAMRKSGNVIALVGASIEDGNEFGTSLEPNSRGVFPLDQGVAAKQRIDRPFDALAGAAAGFGHDLFLSDADGVLRHTVPFVGSASPGTPFLAGVPSLGLAAALKATASGSTPIRMEGRALRVGDRVMPTSETPVDTRRNFEWQLINFHGPALLPEGRRPYASYSFADLLVAEQQLEEGVRPVIDPILFKDKIVFVGVTAAGLSDFDTPFGGSRMPGLQVQVAVADDFLSQRFITTASPYVRVLVAVGLFVIVFSMSVVLSWWWAAIATLAVLFAFGWAATALLGWGYYVYAVEPMLLAVAALFGGRLTRKLIDIALSSRMPRATTG